MGRTPQTSKWTKGLAPLLLLFTKSVTEINGFSATRLTKASAKRQSGLYLSLQSTPVEDTHENEAQTVGRRTFIVAAGSALSGLALHGPLFPAYAGDSVDYKAVSNDIADLIKANPDWGPTIVRLAWHSSGTYDKMSKTGGSGQGTIRFREELVYGANAGLADTAVKWLEPVYQKYSSDGISYADLYTLAGVTAIKVMGGPVIPWSAGRVDAMDPTAVLGDGRLPSADSGEPGADKADADHLRKIFYRMGFNDQEIVALSGAHALGRCHPNASGYDGPWTPTPTTFNNAYFTLLSGLDWKKRDWTGPFQYEAANGSLMMLPTDLVLLKDKSFAKYVQVYAKDGQKFSKDFAAAFNKLEELGTKDLKRVEWA